MPVLFRSFVSDAVIGVIDGTTLPTGQYRLYLEVRCGEGCVKAVDERIIEVQNKTRLGNLDLAFSDLNVTLGGVGIPLVRTYSSSRVGEPLINSNGVLVNDGAFKSDFGPGWNLNILQSGISVSHPSGTTTALDQAFARGTRVFVTLPSGQIQRFTFSPLPMGNSIFVPRLSPDPEFKSELYLRDYDKDLRFILNVSRNDGTYVTTNGNRESIPSNFGSAWILKTEDGLEYEFDLSTGVLRRIQSSSGASLEITERIVDPTNPNSPLETLITTKRTGDGNINGTAKQVVIHRVPKTVPTGSKPEYQIDWIADVTIETPVDSKVYYSYGKFDPVGGGTTPHSLNSLAQVQLLNGDKTSFGYNDPNLQLHLTNIYDNSKSSVFAATYFADIDNDGAITSFDREDDRFGRLEKTTNANSNDTNFGFDFDLGNGKKVRSTRVGGNTVEQVLDSRGNAIRVVTLVTDSTIDADKRYIATITRYNLRGLVVAQSKPFYILGASERFTLEPADPKTDPLAWSVQNTYDREDRKLTVTDSAGGVTTYTYDETNGIQTTTDSFGVTAVRRVNPENGQLIETYSSRIGSTERRDHITYEYDKYGNVTRQWLNLNNGTKILTSQSFYNSDGFLTWSEQAGSPRQYFAYDENGQQTHSWQITSSGRDMATNQDTYTTIVNFQFNNFVREDNPFATSTPANAPHLGSGNGGLQSAQFEIVGTVVYNDSNIPDLKSKLASFDIANSGVRKISESNSIKNAKDQVVETRSLSLDSNGMQHWFITRTTYDSQGRAEYQTNSYRSDTAVAEITGIRNHYDTEGRLVQTDQVKNLNIAVDTSGGAIGLGESSLANDTTVNPVLILSYSTTTYGTLGRVVATTQFSTSDASSGLTSWTISNSKGQVSETREERWNATGDERVIFITRTVYDDRDRVIMQTDSYLEGSLVVYGTRTLYDSADRSYGSVRVKGVVVDIDELGKTTISNDGEDQYQTTSYYNFNRLVRAVDAFGNVSESEYDSFGRQVASIGPRIVVDGVTLRHRTETAYDERGRTVSQTSGVIQDESGNGLHNRAHAFKTSYTFDDAGRVERNIFNDGSFAQIRYDAIGQKVAESKQVAAGTQIEWSDDERSFMKVGTTELIPTRLSEYDMQGRVVAVLLPKVRDPFVLDPNAPNAFVRPTYRYGYSVSGQKSLIIDPYGHETRLDFDALGRQISRTLPLGFGLDGKENTGDDDVAEAFTEYTYYDGRGRPYLQMSFEGVYILNNYDDKTGRLLNTRYFANSLTANNSGSLQETRKNEFDDYGRVITVEHWIDDVLSRVETTSYNDEGLVETTENPEGTIRYSYDVHGRMTTKEWTSSSHTLLPGQTYENRTDYEYDNLGRLRMVTQVDTSNPSISTPTSYTYNLLGGLDRTINANGLIYENDYDSMNRLDKLFHWRDINNNGKRDTNELRAEFDYTVRPDGKRTQAIEKFWEETNPNPILENRFDWSYDAVDRLVSEEMTSSSLANYELDWVYDLAGNRVEQIKKSGATTETTTYNYDANDRLKHSSSTGNTYAEGVIYTYDKTQQASKTTAAGPITTSQSFTYDLQGLLASVTTSKSDEANITKTVYGYDSSGTRISASHYTAPYRMASVVNRSIFYNGAGGGQGLLGPENTALLPGQTSTFQNYTSYSRGLNGMVIDIAGLPADVTPSGVLASLVFSTWNGINTSGFVPLSSAAIPSVQILADGGYLGSDRIIITFPDNTIQNTWLRVELLANATTGLAAADLFYFGNVIGDVNVGNTSTRIRVNATDVGAVRSNQSPLPNSVSVSNPFDINRDGRVDSVDVALVRANQQTSGVVAPITAPNQSPPPPLFTLESKTEYLTDSANPTGYSQVLQETEFNASGQATKKVIYTIGHDQISQTTITIDSSGLQSPASNLTFGSDGHGSVRVLYDLAGVIARDIANADRMQVYTFDAYGNLQGWPTTSLTPNTLPLTTYLYSGESFDFSIGQQYLRARFYDATTGRFNRLDPYFGNSSDPQSFHKYAYVHGDPVQMIDPTGMFGEALYLQVKSAAANLAARSAIEGALREIGKRYGWKLAQNFVEWYYIDNHINGTIDALAGFAYEVSGWRDPNVAAVVQNLNAILGTLTAMRRIMKTSPLLLLPLLSANPNFKGSRLEGLVNFYAGWQGKSRVEGRIAGGLIALGSMPFLIANLNFANTFNNANNERLKFKGMFSPVAMVSRLLVGSAMGTSGNNAFFRTVWLPDIIRSAREKVRLSRNPQSFANAIEFMVREIQEAFPAELDIGVDDDEAE